MRSRSDTLRVLHEVRSAAAPGVRSAYQSWHGPTVGRDDRSGLGSAPMPEAVPPIQYTSARGATLAYQVLGEGPVDVLVVGGMLGHIEASWDEPAIVRFNRRLAASRG